MPKTLQGKLKADGKRFAIVASRFNEFITSKLVEGAVDGLVRLGADDKNVTVVWVPGSFEIPAMARKLARSEKHDAVIGLGAVIRGATTHYDLVSNEAAKGLAHLSMNEDIPVIFGIVTAETIEQAIERAGTKAGNRGFDAAQTAVEMVNLYDQL
jgi:6,7-dimethyl-8-ribityllumazine synthase